MAPSPNTHRRPATLPPAPRPAPGSGRPQKANRHPVLSITRSPACTRSRSAAAPPPALPSRMPGQERSSTSSASATTRSAPPRERPQTRPQRPLRRPEVRPPRIAAGLSPAPLAPGTRRFAAEQGSIRCGGFPSLRAATTSSPDTPPPPPPRSPRRSEAHQINGLNATTSSTPRHTPPAAPRRAHQHAVSSPDAHRDELHRVQPAPWCGSATAPRSPSCRKTNPRGRNYRAASVPFPGRTCPGSTTRTAGRTTSVTAAPPASPAPPGAARTPQPTAISGASGWVQRSNRQGVASAKPVASGLREADRADQERRRRPVDVRLGEDPVQCVSMRKRSRPRPATPATSPAPLFPLRAPRPRAPRAARARPT